MCVSKTSWSFKLCRIKSAFIQSSSACSCCDASLQQLLNVTHFTDNTQSVCFIWFLHTECCMWEQADRTTHVDHRCLPLRGSRARFWMHSRLWTLIMQTWGLCGETQTSCSFTWATTFPENDLAQSREPSCIFREASTLLVLHVLYPDMNSCH